MAEGRRDTGVTLSDGASQLSAKRSNSRRRFIEVKRTSQLRPPKSVFDPMRTSDPRILAINPLWMRHLFVESGTLATILVVLRCNCPSHRKINAGERR
jgi:hypothetical protein